ncbi:MAG TPA: cytochrome c [Blastocatellia bacterium]|nr:cytochrome c [Blastocatellia bacterium]
MTSSRSRRTTVTASAVLLGLTLVVVNLPAEVTGGHPQHKWNIPDSARTMKNPIAATTESLAKGKELFQANCVMCHGEKGDGTGEMARSLDTKPSDLTDATRMEAQTDGELFYKISTGTNEMPEYGAILEKEEIWHLVNYVRSLVTKGRSNRSPR